MLIVVSRPALFSTCLVLRASPRWKTGPTRRSGELLRSPRRAHWDRILFLILGVPQVRDFRFFFFFCEEDLVSSRVISRDKLQHEFLLSSFLLSGTIVAPRAKRSSGSLHWSGMFSCYTSSNVYEEDWRTGNWRRRGLTDHVISKFSWRAFDFEFAILINEFVRNVLMHQWFNSYTMVSDFSQLTGNVFQSCLFINKLFAFWCIIKNQVNQNQLNWPENTSPLFKFDIYDML